MNNPGRELTFIPAPDFDWLMQDCERPLAGWTPSGRDMQVSLSYHGLQSDKALINIKAP